MGNNGWIKLHRSIMDHWLWQDKPFSKGQAMIDLIMIGNYKEQTILVDGSLQNIERGSIVTSVRKLCDRWGWSNTKVRRFLQMLENDGMITVKSDSKKTVINVVNYCVYQDFDEQKTTQKRQTNDTETTVKHTNKKEKKVNNNKYNNTRACACMPPTYEQVSRYCQQRKNHIDVHKFVDYYESKGWTIGGSTMKDWKAAVRYWERSSGNSCVSQEKDSVERLDCDRDYDFESLEKQLFQKQMTG